MHSRRDERVRGMHFGTPTREVLAHPASTRLLSELDPALLAPTGLIAKRDLGIGLALFLSGFGEDDLPEFWQALSRVPRTLPEPAPTRTPAAATAGLPVTAPGPGGTERSVPVEGQVDEVIECAWSGPVAGNPFTDVDLSVRFTHDGADLDVTVGGFYDGDGIFLARFLPPLDGAWRYETASNIDELHGLAGTLTVHPRRTRGPVTTDGEAGFAFRDGTPYVPIGTTAYAWMHQDATMRSDTITTLASAPFNKLRMTVFPKAYIHNTDEPELFPFLRDDTGSWDYTRFDPSFFHRLEDCIRALETIGVQADLILFHPYDRWGFAAMGDDADARYVTYVVRRLAAFPNVWWSLANEWDLIASKDTEDWDRLGSLVHQEDHVRHLLSIHNALHHYDNHALWVTHSSIQRIDHYKTTENVTGWQKQWNKPVIVDEPGYEGDLEYDWGNLGAEEVVRRFWEAYIRGGYASHGETYWSADDKVWWAKGGKLSGLSPARIAFLKRIVADSPSGRLSPIRHGLFGITAGVEGRYEVTYLGLHQPRTWPLTVRADSLVRVEVLDTWNMTIDDRGMYGQNQSIPLPRRAGLAIRVTDSAPIAGIQQQLDSVRAS